MQKLCEEVAQAAPANTTDLIRGESGTGKELKDRVEQIKTRFMQVKNTALDALMDLIADLKAAREAGRTDAELEAARAFERRGQFDIDFTDAENSTGFHAPQESERVLALAIDLCRKGQNALRAPAPPVKLAAK